MPADLQEMYINPTGAESYGIDITPGEPPVDLSTVTEVALHVLRPNRDVPEVQWTDTDLTNQTTTTLTVTYQFGADPDITVDTPGIHTVVAFLTTDVGVVKARPQQFLAKGKYEP